MVRIQGLVAGTHTPILHVSGGRHLGSLRCWAVFILSSLSNKKYTRNRADRSIHPFTQPPTHPISSLMNPDQTPFPLIHFEVMMMMMMMIHVSFFPLVTPHIPRQSSHPSSQSVVSHLISGLRSQPPDGFFFLSSTNSMLSSGISLYFSSRNSSISSLTSPCTTISSPPLGTLVTEEPVANFLPNSLATYHHIRT